MLPLAHADMVALTPHLVAHASTWLQDVCFDFQNSILTLYHTNCIYNKLPVVALLLDPSRTVAADG